MSAASFTPGSALLGGILIGLAASLLYAVNGRIAGISGILAGLVRPLRGDVAWRLWFMLGLVVSGGAAGALVPGSVAAAPRSLSVLMVAGLLVGAGTRLAAGCTSGHGVCGISRGSVRSIAATAAFMTTGVITVAALRLAAGSP